MNYEKYYDLETYIFNDVNQAFHQNKKLTAEQFFCIVIWKANRAKSKIAEKLTDKIKIDGANSLEDKIGVITSKIHQATSSKEKLKVLIDYEFRLPMASAILSVLYPNDFSVYDVRVCEILQDDFAKIADWKFDRMWSRYKTYLEKVKEISKKSNYRDADKYLWAQSFHNQLISDLENNFKLNKKQKPSTKKI